MRLSAVYLWALAQAALVAAEVVLAVAGVIAAEAAAVLAGGQAADSAEVAAAVQATSAPIAARLMAVRLIRLPRGAESELFSKNLILNRNQRAFWALLARPPLESAHTKTRERASLTSSPHAKPTIKL